MTVTMHGLLLLLAMVVFLVEVIVTSLGRPVRPNLVALGLLIVVLSTFVPQ